MFYPLLSTKLR